VRLPRINVPKAYPIIQARLWACPKIVSTSLQLWTTHACYTDKISVMILLHDFIGYMN